MGEVRVKARLANAVEQALVRRGQLEPPQVPSVLDVLPLDARRK
jgi:hypothetical protein